MRRARLQIARRPQRDLHGIDGDDAVRRRPWRLRFSSRRLLLAAGELGAANSPPSRRQGEVDDDAVDETVGVTTLGIGAAQLR
jgi:hypothetical protein